MKKITCSPVKTIIILCIIQLFTMNNTTRAASVSGVHGGFSDEVDLTMSNSNISASAASNWEFDTVSAEPAEYKKAIKSSNQRNDDNAYTETESCDSLGFAFTSFTVKLLGKMNPLGPGSGPCERHFSISGGYKGDYYISPTEAEIPGRTSVAFPYTAKLKDLNTNEESDISSTWNFHPSPYKRDYVDFTPAEQENTTAVTISNTATWKTPDSGSYTITAESYPDGSDGGAIATLKVIVADFSNVNALGYDEYTYWTPQNKYYIDNAKEHGRCINPYISIKQGTSCKIKLNLKPTPSGTVDIEEHGGITSSPDSTSNSCDISITPNSVGTVVIKSFLNWTDHSGNATKTEISYCSGKVYSEITKYVTLYTVNNATLTSPIDILNNTFAQVAIKFSLNNSTHNITATPNGDWTYADITTIRNSIYAIGDDYAIIALPGYYIDHAVGGLVINKSNHIFIFRGLTSTVVAHEMGHCLGLDDEYTYTLPIPPSNTGTGTPGPDEDNLMNCGTTDGKLRMLQWRTIRQ